MPPFFLVLWVSVVNMAVVSRDIADLVKAQLEKRILQVCEDVYWNDADLRSPLDPRYIRTSNPTKTGAYDNPNSRDLPLYGPPQQSQYLERSLSQAIRTITRSGIGKTTTQLLVQRLVSQSDKFTESELFKDQPEVRAKVPAIAREILQQREQSTAELIENNLKAYKEGVEITQAEWEKSYTRTLDLIKGQIVEKDKVLAELLQKYGKKNVKPPSFCHLLVPFS